jgi:hypothetical protein
LDFFLTLNTQVWCYAPNINERANYIVRNARRRAQQQVVPVEEEEEEEPIFDQEGSHLDHQPAQLLNDFNPFMFRIAV